MEEVIKEQIEYILEMINETSNESVIETLDKIKDALTKLNNSIRIDDDISITHERLNKIINFINEETEKTINKDGPTDEEIIDGLNILESNLKQCLNNKTI